MHEKKRMIKLMLILIITCLHPLTSQESNLFHFPRDTSFTVRAELERQLKNYPFITLATNGSNEGLTIFRDLVYWQPEERPLHVDVIFPVRQCQAQLLPVIIILHGGGWRSGDKTMEHPLAFELARRGFATVCVEYRLSPEALYPAAVKDVIAAIRWVKQNENNFPFATNKLALLGVSAGGQLAALVGTINGTNNQFNPDFLPDQDAVVQAVVNIDGVVAFIHPESGEGNDRPGNLSAATRWFGSTTTEDPYSRQQASALTHVNQYSAPILFINSPITRFRAGRDDMISKLEQAGIKTSVKEHVDSMHTFWLFNPWFEITVNWIDSFLTDVFNTR